MGEQLAGIFNPTARSHLWTGRELESADLELQAAFDSVDLPKLPRELWSPAALSSCQRLRSSGWWGIDWRDRRAITVAVTRVVAATISCAIDRQLAGSDSSTIARLRTSRRRTVDELASALITSGLRSSQEYEIDDPEGSGRKVRRMPPSPPLEEVISAPAEKWDSEYA